ncbi:MAG: SRPBCC family protein [Hyphomicrobiaceae bacterium]|nr:SRPBCC family protein [Hyphomicrobiaceae bacterium]
MQIDIAAALRAVVREVSSREHEGRMARVIVAARTYDTDIDDLWDALTNAERIPRWFLPVSGDLRLGGRYQFQGNAGGKIQACEPPRHLAVTWEHGGDVSWVTVRLAEAPQGGTRLELEHVAHVDDKRWDEFGPGAVGVGWDGAMMGLGRHLETGEAVDPQAAMAWLDSPEGKTFMRGSSDAWCAASIAAGTGAAAARTAAARTTAFYTGESPPSAGP